jgi:hypothetical protein
VTRDGDPSGVDVSSCPKVRETRERVVHVAGLEEPDLEPVASVLTVPRELAPHETAALLADAGREPGAAAKEDQEHIPVPGEDGSQRVALAREGAAAAVLVEDRGKGTAPARPPEDPVQNQSSLRDRDSVRGGLGRGLRGEG